MGDTTAQTRVLDLEKTKTNCNEIDSLKRRVKKLEKRNRSRTYKLKRLYKVGFTARVESFGDKESLGEDASKQGRRINVINADEDITLGRRINVINADEDITMVSVQDDTDKEMFDVDDLGGEENMKGYKLKDLKLKEFDRTQEMFDKAFRRVNTFEDFRPELVEGKAKRA
nr:hypothetical protein [Tanacetum cinerariifolium]GEZ85331.1 hypothetical protein [Tanacetum cinerariifolium]